MSSSPRPIKATLFTIVSLVLRCSTYPSTRIDQATGDNGLAPHLRAGLDTDNAQSRVCEPEVAVNKYSFVIGAPMSNGISHPNKVAPVNTSIVIKQEYSRDSAH